MGMRTDKILYGFQEIKRAFPDAEISNSYRVILIPRFPLPSQFNKPYTSLLIKINSDYQAPDAYVDRELRVYGQKSNHLSEALTEDYMLERGWVKLCIQVSWSPSFSLVDYMLMLMQYFKELRE
jgi:hypothetical protein